MRNFAVSLMNYRCFSGAAPVTWKFPGDSLTSFVGPNNAGKSTFLRLFYELRTVFGLLTDPGQLNAFATGNDRGLAFHGVDDPAEIPSFESPGPVVIDLGIDVTNPSDLCRVRLSMNRNTSGWKGQFWAGPEMNEVRGEQNFQRLTTGVFIEWMRRPPWTRDVHTRVPELDQSRRGHPLRHQGGNRFRKDVG